MNSRLKDKVALVTGSTTGIGEAMAKRFASEGARVMVHGLSESEAKAVVQAILEQGGEAAYTSRTWPIRRQAGGWWTRYWSGSSGWTSWSTMRPK